MKNLSNFARGKKKSSDTCPYDNSSWHGQPKPYLSQPALPIPDLSPEQDESSSSVSPSPRSRSSPLNGGTPTPLNAGTRSFDWADIGRNERTSGSAQPTSAATPRLSPVTTINRNGQSPLTTITSPTSGRSVSFDIPRSPSNKDDKSSKPGNFKPMSPYVNPPGNLTDVFEECSPCQVTNNSSPDLPGTGCSPITNLPPNVPKIEGLPDPSEPINPSLFPCAQPIAQPPADEVPNLTPDRTPTPPFRSPMNPEPPNYHEATNSPVLTPVNISPATLPPKRGALLRLSSMPPPAFMMNGESGSVRFSPAPIARHFPTAVLPLPPTSIARRSTSPAPSLRSNASRARLRSVPALAMDGTEDGGGDGSDDEDDHDDDHVPVTTSPASEDEDDDATTERDGSSTYVSANCSPVDLCPSSTSFLVDMNKAPVPKPPLDYFSIHTTRSGSVNWTASTPNSNTKRASLTPRERPVGLYHQPSKSMVNLLSSQRRDLSIIDEETKGKSKATDSVSPAAATEDDVLPEGSRIQRRRSLPMFTAATDPPPYPSLEIPGKSTQKVIPRDEEGKEKLPEYNNDVFLSAVLPRKLEFSSPGVQSRDRKWRRVLCVLEGTAFRVYEPPTSVVGIGAVGRWWEKKVGVGDLTSDAPLLKKTTTTTPGSQKIDLDLDGDEGRSMVGLTPSVASSERESAKKLKLHAHGLLHRNGNSSGTSSRRHSGETLREDGRNGLSVSTSRPSVSSITANTTGRPSASSYKRAASPMLSKPAQPEHIPCPQNCQLLRAYTLQHAESGLASDYLKRKNVIRVRLEGEQFLVQAPSVQAVVEWIEVSFFNCAPGGGSLVTQILTAMRIRVFKPRQA